MKLTIIFTLLVLSLSGCKKQTVAEWLTDNLNRCEYLQGYSFVSPDRSYFSCFKRDKKLFATYYQKPKE